MLRTGDWTEEKFRCNLLVSLARKLFFLIGFVCINWTHFELNNWILLDLITMNWTLILITLLRLCFAVRRIASLPVALCVH